MTPNDPIATCPEERKEAYVEEKRRLAMQLFREGHNCAQSVFLAFRVETGMDRETALRLTSAMGGGVARLREICGAISGLSLVAGMLHGSTDPLDQEVKTRLYERVQAMSEVFRKENGSIICRELLALPEGPDQPTPEKRTETYYRLRPCGEYVGCAAAILARSLTS